jgi:signal peptidase
MSDKIEIVSTSGVILLGLVVLPFVVYAVPQVVGASHSYVVLSSSMEPTFHAGDAVIVDGVQPANVDEGDVIVFEPSGGFNGAERVTHRVVEVVERDDGLYFRTKGDANGEPDAQLVPAENVVGRVTFHIPLIGRVAAVAGSDAGIVALVIVPSVLFVANEVWTLVAAARADDRSDGDLAATDE